MSQYPVEDTPGVYEAVNYLLSGPSGLGQNFAGNSSFLPVYIRPSPRSIAPFTLPIGTTLNTDWYVDIPINNIVPIVPGVGNPFQLTVTFTAAQPNPPFQFGDIVTLSGVNPSAFDQTYTVFSSTTTDVVLTAAQAQVWPAYVGGGSVVRNFANQPISTDCNARVTVSGGEDRVFISAQINLDYAYDATVASDFDIVAQINRYAGLPNNIIPASLQGTGVITDLDYLFNFSGTVAQKIIPKSVTGAGTEQLEIIFTTVLDGPAIRPDFYWYILEIGFVTKPTIPSIYGTRAGAVLNNQFDGSGVIEQTVVPGTVFAAVALTGGTGAGATADITLWPDPLFTDYNVGDYATAPASSGVNTEIAITAGTGYLVGDVLTVPGTSLGGASPANDMTLVVTQVQYAGDATPGTFIARQRSLSAQVVKQ